MGALPDAEPPMADLPPLADLLDRVLVVRIPLRVRFRGTDVREVALLPGPRGWGEFGAFPEYPPAEAAAWLAAAIEAGYAGWPAPVRTEIPVNATVPAVPAARVGEVLDRFPGCRTVKVKVAEPGQRLEDDVDRVAAVRDRIGAAGAIRVDANGAWDVPQARAALARLAAYRLEYAEQPCPTVEQLAQLRVALAREGLDVLIAADESIRRASDPVAVARRAAADLVVVKAAPLGGVRAALRVVDRCGLPAVVSSALDTSIGMAAGVALAAALPRLDHACGLGTVALLGGDVTGRPVTTDAGRLRVAPPPNVDERLAARWAAPADRQHWWRRRIAACYEIVASRGGD